MKERRRLGSFLAIGIINTVIDVVIFLGLRQLNVPIFIANIISTTIALGGSYVFNQRFTFRTNGNAKRSLPLFISVTLIGLWILQPIVIRIVLALLHSDQLTQIATALVSQPQRYFELVAKLAATPVTLVWNYVLYKKVVFKDNS